MFTVPDCRHSVIKQTHGCSTVVSSFMLDVLNQKPESQSILPMTVGYKSFIKEFCEHGDVLTYVLCSANILAQGVYINHYQYFIVKSITVHSH